jgi:hypothetical protein
MCGVRLDAENFAGGVRHRLVDGRVDLLHSDQCADRRYVRSSAGTAHSYERLERGGKPLLAAPLVGDAVGHAAQELMKCDDRGDGQQEVRILNGRL